MKWQCYIWYVLVLFIMAPHQLYAQKKKGQKEKEKTVEKAPPAKKDSIRFVYDTVSAKPATEKQVIEPLYKKTETVLPAATKKNIDKKGRQMNFVYDTVKYKRKMTGEEEIIQDPNKDTVTYMGKNKRTSLETPAKIVIVKDEGSCKCVEMNLKAQDTVGYEDYVNYTFIFKNNCKDLVYVHSGSFRFTVANVFGQPIKRIRKVDFVKRFDYPEFVPLSPGETYEFRFADDPFFEFAMNRAQEYKFTFMYNNPSRKHRTSPNKTHLCTELRDHNVFVR